MPKPSDSDTSGLKRFLAEEVRHSQYADQLLAWAEAARRGEPAPGASGDTYYVAFGQDEVVIENRYEEDWEPVRLATGDFIAALQRRRKELKS